MSPSEQTREEQGALRRDTSRCRALGWLAVFVGVFLVRRLALPFAQWDPAAVHAAVAGSAAAGQAWGRQGLIGSQEFPFLPTLAMLVCSSIFRLDAASAARFVTALAQAWALCYLLRPLTSLPRRFLALLLAVPALVLTPPLRLALLAADPAWIVAVPMAAGIWHAEQWRRQRNIRDLVLTAANAALLVFAGPTGTAAAIGLALGVAWALHHTPRRERVGNVFLLWSPLAYAVGLLLLLNWLILADPFFAWRPVFRRLAGVGNVSFDNLGDLFFTFLPAPLLGACLAIMLFRPLYRKSVAAPGIAAAAAAGCAALTLVAVSAAGVYAAGGLPVVAVATSAAVCCLVGALPRRVPRPAAAFAAAAWTASLACGTLQPESHPPGADFLAGMPAPRNVLNTVDRQWPGARILVFGMRLPARFPDPASRRFIPRLDLHPGVILRQARNEVLFLLTPPPDAVPADLDPEFADISRRGRSWLFLEHRWNSGWRLWRVALQPDRYSPVRQILHPRRP